MCVGHYKELSYNPHSSVCCNQTSLVCLLICVQTTDRLWLSSGLKVRSIKGLVPREAVGPLRGRVYWGPLGHWAWLWDSRPFLFLPDLWQRWFWSSKFLPGNAASPQAQKKRSMWSWEKTFFFFCFWFESVMAGRVWSWGYEVLMWSLPLVTSNPQKGCEGGRMGGSGEGQGAEGRGGERWAGILMRLLLPPARFFLSSCV